MFCCIYVCVPLAGLVRAEVREKVSDVLPRVASNCELLGIEHRSLHKEQKVPLNPKGFFFLKEIF